MAITNQATLRTAVADWLNRTDLTNTQLDLFIQMAEAKVYEKLRVPPLETLEGFSVLESNSSVTIPSGFLELIELRHVKTGTCSVSPTTNITRALCSIASGTWTDADKNDDISLSRVDGKAFHNNKLANAFTRELGNFLLTDKEGEQKASGEYILKYYKADSPIGTTTGSPAVEVVPYILSDEYEIVLYSTLAIGSAFLGNIEDEVRYHQMFLDKVTILNTKAKQAELEGGIFTQNFANSLI
jgi:hypothetical protein